MQLEIEERNALLGSKFVLIHRELPLIFKHLPIRIIVYKIEVIYYYFPQIFIHIISPNQVTESYHRLSYRQYI